MRHGPYHTEVYVVQAQTLKDVIQVFDPKKTLGKKDLEEYGGKAHRECENGFDYWFTFVTHPGGGVDQ
ncbi:MAG: hypothetical protein C5S48_09860 [Candidatus Methanogaster sp.]|nr:MAG: hypothetical protein C5S48_09860 [ANME-2 cluster archaeon]